MLNNCLITDDDSHAQDAARNASSDEERGEGNSPTHIAPLPTRRLAEVSGNNDSARLSSAKDIIRTVEVLNGQDDVAYMIL